MFNLTIKYLGANLKTKLNKIVESDKVKSTKFVPKTYETDPASRIKKVDYLSPSKFDAIINEWKVEDAKKLQMINDRLNKNHPFGNDFRNC